MTRAFQLTCTLTITALLNACSGSSASMPTAPSSRTTATNPGPAAPTGPSLGTSLEGAINIRDISPQPGAVLRVRDCAAGRTTRLCTDDWRGTFDVVIDRELRHVVLTARFYEGDLLCGYAADTRDTVTVGQTVSFAPSTVYLSDEFGTFVRPCPLSATTTRIVVTVWTDTDWNSSITREFAVPYSFTD